MKARFMLDNPGLMEATMTITMTVDEWEQLREQLAEKWPSSRLSSAITTIMVDARKTFSAEEKEASF